MKTPVLAGRFLSPARPLGERPLLVLGPSLGTSTRLWEETAERLSAEHDLLAWDLPGHGSSPAVSEPFEVADLADAVVALVQEKAPGSAFHYAGVSLGGATALEIGLRHADRVRSIAVICSGPKLGTAEAWNERAALVREQGTVALVGGSLQRWFAPGFPEREPKITEELLDALRKADDESYARCCEALAAFDVREMLSAITVPTLALAGAEDAVAPPAMAEAIIEGITRVSEAEDRVGQAVTLDGVAHLAPAEAPGAVDRILRSFIENPRTELSTKEK